MIKLNIGSGGTKIPGFISVDLYHPKADLKKDAAETGYEKFSVDYIFTSHLVEHLEPSHFERALTHWYEILKPNGMLEILCPNAKVYIEEWIKSYYNNETENLMNWGRRNLLGWEDKGVGMWNRNLFTTEILKLYLIGIGFKKVECHEQETRVKDKNHFEYRSNGDIRCLAVK